MQNPQWIMGEAKQAVAQGNAGQCPWHCERSAAIQLRSWFDKLTTNGTTHQPFVLSLSSDKLTGNGTIHQPFVLSLSKDLDQRFSSMQA